MKIFDHPEARAAFFREHDVETRDGIAVLRGFVSTENLVHVCVWCPYCQVFHLHGTGGAEVVAKEGVKAGDGHRVAHCIDDDSPFRRGGYYVEADRFGSKREFHLRRPKCHVCGRGLPKYHRTPYHDKCREEFAQRYAVEDDAA